MSNPLDQLQQVYQTTNTIALATSFHNEADVKVINFVWFSDEPTTMYFSSVRGSHALNLYAEHANASLTTIPFTGTPNNPFIRAHDVHIAPSSKTMADLLPRYLELIPNYQQVWDAIGPTLAVYEIHFQQLHVDPGLGQPKFDLDFTAIN
ncbi:pyridoxamine 5'-phosphate oxidase [Furfurilactobacillus curtus]|uniref:Pyridoxamine 5'-phosphate oxidase n=1 Tax=Furfurilactobacillus curtus TaxID=1746200 RepID=A0ABQ5JP25_9LACO